MPAQKLSIAKRTGAIFAVALLSSTALAQAQSAAPVISAGNAALAQRAQAQLATGAPQAIFDLGPAPAAVVAQPQMVPQQMMTQQMMLPGMAAPVMMQSAPTLVNQVPVGAVPIGMVMAPGAMPGYQPVRLPSATVAGHGAIPGQVPYGSWTQPNGVPSFVTAPPQIYQQQVAAAPQPARSPILGQQVPGKGTIYQAATYQTTYNGGLVTNVANGAVYPKLSDSPVASIDPNAQTAQVLRPQFQQPFPGQFQQPFQPYVMGGQPMLPQTSAVTVPPAIVGQLAPLTQPSQNAVFYPQQQTQVMPQGDYRGAGETIYFNNIASAPPSDFGPGELLSDLPTVPVSSDLPDLTPLPDVTTPRFDDSQLFERRVAISLAPMVSGLMSAYTGDLSSVASTFGGSGDIAIRLTPWLGARAGIDGAFGTGELTKGGADYDIEGSAIFGNLLMDVHPFRNGFRLSAGPGFGVVNIEADDTATGANGVETSGFEFAPYFGLGYDGALFGRNRWSVKGELGAHYLTQMAETSYTGTGATDAETILVRDQFEDARFIPSAKIGLSIGF